MSNSLTSWLFGPPPPPRAGYSVDNDEVECFSYGTWVEDHPGPNSLEPTYLASAVLLSLHERVKASTSDASTVYPQGGAPSGHGPTEGRTAAWGVVSDREPLNTGRRYRDSEAGQEDVLITVVTTPWEVKGNDLFKREDIPALRLIAGPMPFPPQTPLEDDLLTAEETPLSNENSSPPEAEYLIQVDRQLGDFPSYSRRRVVVFGIPEGSYRRFRGIDSLTDHERALSSEAAQSSDDSHAEISLPKRSFAHYSSEEPRSSVVFSLPPRAAYALAAIKVTLASSMLSDSSQFSRPDKSSVGETEVGTEVGPET